MKHYPKTDGYKWTDGNGNYYVELYTPDDAQEYTLVADADIPHESQSGEPTPEEYAEAGRILFGEDVE